MTDDTYIDIVDWFKVHCYKNNDEIAKKLKKILNLLHATDKWLLELLNIMIKIKIIENVTTWIRSDWTSWIEILWIMLSSQV